MVLHHSLTGTPTATVDEPNFCVGDIKLVAMSMATFGLYSLYWLYRNWKVEQTLSGESIIPAARAIFSIVFFHSFASRVAQRADIDRRPARYSPIVLTVVFVLLTLSGRLPAPWWLLSVFNVLPLVPIQRTLADLDSAKGLDSKANRLFTGGEIAAFALGSALWLLAVTGLLLPEPT